MSKRLVENQYRALLFDVQERTRVEIDPISGATSFERLTGSPHRSPILPLVTMVECLVPSDRKPGGVLVVAKGTHEHFDQCGLVAQRKAMNISL